MQALSIADEIKAALSKLDKADGKQDQQIDLDDPKVREALAKELQANKAERTRLQAEVGKATDPQLLQQQQATALDNFMILTTLKVMHGKYLVAKDEQIDQICSGLGHAQVIGALHKSLLGLNSI